MGKKDKNASVEEEVDEAEIEKLAAENANKPAPQLTKEDLDAMDDAEPGTSRLALIGKMIKKVSIGTDISNISMPGSFILAKSTLSYFSDNFSSFFGELLKANKIDNELERMLQVQRYLFTTLKETEDTTRKPLNPILGETWQANIHVKDGDGNDVTDNYFFAEQISHHPPISSSTVYNKKEGVNCTFCLPVRSQFMGTYVKISFEGESHITFEKYDEKFTFVAPPMAIRIFRSFSEYVGKGILKSDKNDYLIKSTYTSKPIFGGVYNGFESKVYKGKEKLYKIKGTWSGDMKITNLKTNETTPFFTRPTESAKVVFPDDGNTLPTDSSVVWKGVFDASKKDDVKGMSQEKVKVEEEQRKLAHHRKNADEWKPVHFNKIDGRWQLVNLKD
ncbi:hypothetical protein ACTFIW_002495 [Dictyostelium discoideum]